MQAHCRRKSTNLLCLHGHWVAAVKATRLLLISCSNGKSHSPVPQESAANLDNRTNHGSETLDITSFGLILVTSHVGAPRRIPLSSPHQEDQLLLPLEPSLREWPIQAGLSCLILAVTVCPRAQGSNAHSWRSALRCPASRHSLPFLGRRALFFNVAQPSWPPAWPVPQPAVPKPFSRP